MHQAYRIIPATKKRIAAIMKGGVLLIAIAIAI